MLINPSLRHALVAETCRSFTDVTWRDTFRLRISHDFTEKKRRLIVLINTTYTKANGELVMSLACGVSLAWRPKPIRLSARGS